MNDQYIYIPTPVSELPKEYDWYAVLYNNDLSDMRYRYFNSDGKWLNEDWIETHPDFWLKRYESS